MSDAALLREIGEALYGPRWQSELARRRGVADRTVRRWDAGDTTIPEGLWAELRGDLAERRGELGELIRRLPR